jgi:hypothetical protein
MKLAQSQAALYALIVDARGAQPKLAERIVEPNARLSSRERVDIYTRQYPARMHDALAEDFPCLVHALGHERFEALVAAYTRAHPSEHHDLGRFGRRLPSFLRRRARTLPRPDLADLAALEWARTDCFLAADAAPVGRDALGALPPDAIPHARLLLVPGLAVLDAQHDVLPLWKALDAGRRAPKPSDVEHGHTVVWRKGFQVFHAPVGKPEAKALRLAQAGEPLAAVMMPWSRLGTAVAFGALASWFGEGMVAGVRRPAHA